MELHVNLDDGAALPAYSREDDAALDLRASESFRIFRAVMVAITAALLLIASALALVIADIAMGRMVAGMGW